MWNKKSQTMIYGLMLGLIIIVLALALAPPVSQFTNSARNVTEGDTIGLDCTNSSISNFDKATCVVTDLNLFYFIGGLIFIAGAVIVAKIVFE
jgi:hypothetical protein